ncbi:hypothetical protein PGT21_032833 [Puccinia graminis f. sp. tritici]|uniref:Uncharacterized protein n=1 Tax=Puccinia graminis f. sp. tritici TaxID=56615 RepID=A0A5B0QK47_PUCGR|nr:hypothetical protein PGT21_032833 [Puccinia graminis f. sp. tritici]
MPQGIKPISAHTGEEMFSPNPWEQSPHVSPTGTRIKAAVNKTARSTPLLSHHSNKQTLEQSPSISSNRKAA